MLNTVSPTNTVNINKRIDDFVLYWPIIGFLMLLAVSLIVVSFHPSTRPAILDWTDSFFPERKVLARADAVIMPGQAAWQVVKLQVRREIHVEIYRNQNLSSIEASQTAEQNQPTIERKVTRLNLAEGKDVFVNFRGQATNLVVTDVNADGFADIVVPILDENLVPRLQVFVYDKSLDDFIRSQGHSL